MSVKVTGQEKLIKSLEERLGKSAMNRISDDALKAGAKVFIAELKRQVKTFSDGKGSSEGYTYDEITMSEPMTIKGVRTIRIHWKGPHNRYRIIHLNEWGTVNNPNPRGKGSIARAMRNAQNEYRRVIKDAIRRGI